MNTTTPKTTKPAAIVKYMKLQTKIAIPYKIVKTNCMINIVVNFGSSIYFNIANTLLVIKGITMR